MIYLDNAATSWPKAPGVGAAIERFLERGAANPGRSAHRLSIEAGRMVLRVREALAALLGVQDPLRVILTGNATEALNLALHGLLRPGDHVVTSSMEHNSVMRPLRRLEAGGVALSVVPAEEDGRLAAAAIVAALRPETALVAVTHASNVVGTILPVGEIAAALRPHGVPLLVDAAASAGLLPVDVDGAGIDLLAFTGHKALYGPTGTGGLALGAGFDAARLRPLKQGGTGSRSEHEVQPDFLPDALECGTLNTTGLAGLEAALGWIAEQDVAALRARQVELLGGLLAGLAALPGVTVYGPREAGRQVANVSFNVAGLTPSEVGLRLDEEAAICCRVGLHCAPAAHRTIGTFPRGTVRLSPGAFTTADEIETAVRAVAQLARGRS
jgi:cysteine desulfurase family protein